MDTSPRSDTPQAAPTLGAARGTRGTARREDAPAVDATQVRALLALDLEARLDLLSRQARALLELRRGRTR